MTTDRRSETKTFEITVTLEVTGPNGNGVHWCLLLNTVLGRIVIDLKVKGGRVGLVYWFEFKSGKRLSYTDGYEGHR